MSFLGLSGLINFVTSSLIAIFVILKSSRNRVNISFFNLNFSVALYSFGYFFWQLAKDETQAIFWFKILTVGIILINITYLYFVFHFLDLIDKKRNLLRTCATINFIFIALNLSSNLYTRLEPRYNLGFWPVPTIFFHIYLAFWFWQCFYGFYWLLKGLKIFTGIKREQVKYFTLSALFGFFGGATNWPMWYNMHLPPYLNITISLYIGIVAYVIFRYRLMDIRVVVTRTGVLLFVYGLVFGTPLIVVYSFKEYLRTTLGSRWWIPPVVLYGILSTVAPFISIFIQRKAEDRLLREQRETQEALIRVFKHITKVRELDKLVKLIAKLLTTVLRVEHSAVFLLDRRRLQYHLASSKGNLSYFQETILPGDSLLIKHIQKHRNPLVYEELKLKSSEQNSNEVKEIASLMHNISAQVIIPSFIKDSLIGFAILGNKTSGEIYTQQDLLTLSVISDRFALAIEYAQFLKELEEIHTKLREAEKLKGIAQLMHSLNHELLNLFNKMSMPIQLIMMGDIDPNDKVNFENTLKTINDAMETSIEILGYISNYRNKSKSNELKSRKIDGSIDNALNRFSKRFQEANIKIIKTIQPGLPDIQAKDTLDDLFVNILANSYFALIDKLEGERRIEIQANLLDDKNTIQIKISDTGPDMTKSTYQTDIDSPFKERGKIGGVNFGLAYLITNQHDGSLTVESYPKGGTTFVINIPVTP